MQPPRSTRARVAPLGPSMSAVLGACLLGLGACGKAEVTAPVPLPPSAPADVGAALVAQAPEVVPALAPATAPPPPSKSDDADIRYAFGIYFAEVAPAVKAELDRWGKTQTLELAGTGAEPFDASKRSKFELVWLDGDEGSPPPPDMVRALGEGLDEADFKALTTIHHALLVGFSGPRADAWALHRKALRLADTLATRLGGYLWDDASRQLFSRVAWEARAADPSEVPSFEDAVTVHLYRDGEGMRAVSLGMAKFGLPDLVVEQASHSFDFDPLVGLLGQTILERAQRGPVKSLALSVDAIRQPSVQHMLRGAMGPGASGRAEVELVVGKRQAGDPENDLLELALPAETERRRQAQGALELQLFGPEEKAARDDLRHDEEILAASAKARAEVAAIAPRFRVAAPEGQTLWVKAPFEFSNGHEYMWVEVVRWADDAHIRGTLLNEPEQVPALHKGASVEVRLATLFDYQYHDLKGNEAGGEVEEILRKRHGL